MSVYLSQLIRLGHANWALLTVLVLAPAQYVGAIGPRSVARVIGTVIGGFIGVWLVGNYQQDRLFFLLFTFGFVWLCMYMYGGTFFPYSFFLLANTLITVSSSGIFHPLDAWSVGITRTLEILTGVVSINIVSHLLWPRFARRDFHDLAKSTLGNIGKLIELRRRSPGSGAKLWEDAQSTILGIRAQSIRLRALLQSGANESVYFRRHLADYRTAVVSLNHLFQASLELFRQQKGDRQCVGRCWCRAPSCVRSSRTGIADALQRRGIGEADQEQPIKNHLRALEVRIQDLLTSGAAQNYSLEDMLDLANHQAALLTIYDEALRQRAILANLPLPGDPPGRDRSATFHWPSIA